MAEPNFLDFSDFLETQPQALYQSYLSDPNTRMTSSMKRYYQNQFANIQNEYLGKLARDMRAGNVPTYRFDDYLKSNVFTTPYTPTSSDPNRNFMNQKAYDDVSTTGSGNPNYYSSPMGRFTGYDRFRRESPYARGQYGYGPGSQSIFAPSARWITY